VTSTYLEIDMQSSMLHFCDECGAAHAEDATICAACQRPLSALKEAAPAPAPVAVAAVTVSPAAPLEVTAGSPVSTGPLGPGALLVGRYRILHKIGQGGFGSVYRARDLQKHGRLVAIKQIDLNKLKPQEIIEATDSFNREVTLLSSLKHPNLPRLYAHFTDASHWYLVMEYIKGRTLEDYLKRSRQGYLSLNQVMNIGVALADVLAYLHARRPAVIFRDVKPANIMLTRTGHVYLIDFGIARRFSLEKNKDTSPLGSPGYAAPEQYGRAQTDQRTDMYGLGATLQALLTGRDPLELRLVQPPLRSKPLPADLQALLASMLEADPTKRPPDMMTVAECCVKLLRRRANILSLSKGLLIGSIFPLCYLVLAIIGPQPMSSSYNYPALDLLVLLDVFLRCASIGGVLLLGILFFRVKNRWLVSGMLIMLTALVLLAFLNIIPPIYFFPDPS
jgi:serine/threonine protein kinase